MIEGAARVLTEMRPTVFCELNDVLLRHSGSSSEELLDGFARVGYTLAGPVGRRHRSLEGRCVDVVLEPR